MKVVLFDIDGTLIRSGGAGVRALALALQDEFGVGDPHLVPVHGCTDRGIARELFEANGIEPSELHWHRFQQAYLSHLRSQLQETEGEVLPGVLGLLDPLFAHPDVYLGLLTGNVRKGARLKLEHFSLDHFFRGGGYGDHHTQRDDVARWARSSVEGELGTEGDVAQWWVVGDTPNDVRCARAIQANVVAVSTGGSDRAALEETQPDLLVDDLTECESWLESVLDDP